MSTAKPNRRQFLHASATLAAGAAAAQVPGPRNASKDPAREWQQYGGDPGASRYSPLDQINKSNVKRLKVAWSHSTEDAMERPATTIECEPIVIDGVMYIQTAQLQTRALDAATGKVLWSFVPTPGSTRRRGGGVSRGLAYWRDPENPKSRRIYAPHGERFFCLDAETGKAVPGFAEEGMLNLRKDYDPDRPDWPTSMNQPPAIFKDLVICGGGGGDGVEPSAAGHIRAFDARTGKRRWIFHTIPKPGEFGHDTWGGDSWKTAGGTNNWGGMSVDLKRGWVFISTGSPAFDYYGGNRKGTNLFGNCVLALKADTGERVWHYQTTHHDVWDYDLPCQPALVTMRQGGRTFDAVVQMSKMGFVFVFDRATGKPVFPIEERKVPASDVPGEELWPTQPFPVKPPPLNRIDLTEDDVTNISPESKAAILEVLKRSKYGQIYTPPSLEGTIVHPGFRGGVLMGRLQLRSEAEPRVRQLRRGGQSDHARKGASRQAVSVRAAGTHRLEGSGGLPCIKPPWGYMTAIDMDSGSFAWRVVNGEFAALKARGHPEDRNVFNRRVGCDRGRACVHRRDVGREVPRVRLEIGRGRMGVHAAGRGVHEPLHLRSKRKAVRHDRLRRRQGIQ